jgi:hypothetical protein
MEALYDTIYFLSSGTIENGDGAGLIGSIFEW